jgi:hypothetical protein
MAEFEAAVVTSTWQGFTGAPGYTKHAFIGPLDAAGRNAAGAAVRNFWSQINQYLSTAWSITVNPIVQTFDVVTGDLQREETMTTPPAVVTGAATPVAYAGGSGFVVHWITGGVHNGRKIRGRTFVVPAMACYSTSPVDGTISAAVVTAVTAAGNTLCAASGANFGVWSRYWDDSTPPKQIGGGITEASGCVVPDRAAQLRTRRS